jgi:hypothetical protein
VAVESVVVVNKRRGEIGRGRCGAGASVAKHFFFFVADAPNNKLERLLLKSLFSLA